MKDFRTLLENLVTEIRSSDPDPARFDYEVLYAAESALQKQRGVE